MQVVRVSRNCRYIPNQEYICHGFHAGFPRMFELDSTALAVQESFSIKVHGKLELSIHVLKWATTIANLHALRRGLVQYLIYTAELHLFMYSAYQILHDSTFVMLFASYTYRESRRHSYVKVLRRRPTLQQADIQHITSLRGGEARWASKKEFKPPSLE